MAYHIVYETPYISWSKIWLEVDDERELPELVADIRNNPEILLDMQYAANDYELMRSDRSTERVINWDGKKVPPLLLSISKEE